MVCSFRHVKHPGPQENTINSHHPLAPCITQPFQFCHTVWNINEEKRKGDKAVTRLSRKFGTAAPSTGSHLQEKKRNQRLWKCGRWDHPPAAIFQIHRHLWIHEVRMSSAEDCEIHFQCLTLLTHILKHLCYEIALNFLSEKKSVSENIPINWK